MKCLGWITERKGHCLVWDSCSWNRKWTGCIKGPLSRHNRAYRDEVNFWWTFTVASLGEHQTTLDYTCIPDCRTLQSGLFFKMDVLYVCVFLLFLCCCLFQFVIYNYLSCVVHSFQLIIEARVSALSSLPGRRCKCLGTTWQNNVWIKDTN